MPNYLQIHTFIEVAHSASFAEAARRLSLPRSTVSARVQALEKRLKVRLLQRTTRYVALTDEGRRYLEQCEDALNTLMQAEAEVNQGNELSGMIKITMPVDMPKQFIARTLKTFTDRYPAVQLEVIVSDDIMDLVTNRIDIALRGNNPGLPGLIARKLMTSTLAFYASPLYEKENSVNINSDSTQEYQVLNPAKQNLQAFFTKVRKPDIETLNFELAKALAIESTAIALLPENLCKEEVTTSKLTKLRVNNLPPTLPLYIVMPTRKQMPARVRALIDFLVESTQDSKNLS